MRSDSYYLERVARLRDLNQPWERQRIRLRDIMNGGEGAVRALLGRDSHISGDDLHTVNLMEAGLSRAAHKLGLPPKLKVAPPVGKENDLHRRRATKRYRIVSAYDELSGIDLHLPQVARWLLGYGYAVWVHRTELWDGAWYPTLELRDSFDCWPGYFGPDQSPRELCFVRQVDEGYLKEQYPSFVAAKQSATAGRMTGNREWSAGGATHLRTQYDASWEGKAGDCVVIEYMDAEGTAILAPVYGAVLDYIPNPVPNQYPFTFLKRYAFDALKGQFDNAVGMMAMMAKLNILALIASEDAVFRETNVIGDLIGQRYNRGRFAVNYFQQGARIERPGADVAYGVFQQIDRLERQIRVDTQYSVIDDAQSPNSFVTGQGLDRLSASGDLNIAEHQTVIAAALRRADSYRLAWDEQWTAPGVTKQMPSESMDESYTPSRDIAGRYATRRIYGVMAGWDEPQKIVTGLQLLQAGALDLETMQENLTGIDDVNQIRERNRRDGAEQQLVGALAMRAQEGDPGAMMALVEIFQNPDKMGDILAKFFTPQEPQLSPEEMMMMQGMMGQDPGMMGEMGQMGSPPGVTTVLSQMDQAGGVEGGIQTVGRL